jgi:hypothetical protein
MKMVPEEQNRIRQQIISPLPKSGSAPSKELSEFPKFSNQTYIMLGDGIRRKVDKFVHGLHHRDPGVNGYPVSLHHIISKSKWLKSTVWSSLYNRVNTNGQPIDVKVLIAVRNYVQEFDRYTSNFPDYSLFHKFIWNPGNLFTGPEPHQRTDDPGFYYIAQAQSSDNEDYALRLLASAPILKTKLEQAISVAINLSQERVPDRIDDLLHEFFTIWKEIMPYGLLVGVFERDMFTPTAIAGNRSLRLTSIITAVDCGNIPSNPLMTVTYKGGDFVGG